MLFDLQGRRKTAIKGIYLALALLLGGGLVLFGVGSSVNGGLADVFKGGGNDNQFIKDLEKAQKKIAASPKDHKAYSEAIQARYGVAGDPKYFNQDTSEFNEKGKAVLTALTDDWAQYEKIAGNKLDANTANYVVQAYVGLQDAKGALQVQRLIADRDPTATNYLFLMRYALAAGDQTTANLSALKAEDLASGAEMSTVQTQIKELRSTAKKQLADQNKQIQAQFQEQIKQQQGSQPLNGLPTPPAKPAEGAK